MKKLLMKLVKGYVLSLVKKNKKAIVARINSKVDIPHLNEAQEAQIMGVILDVLTDILSSKLK